MTTTDDFTSRLAAAEARAERARWAELRAEELTRHSREAVLSVTTAILAIRRANAAGTRAVASAAKLVHSLSGAPHDVREVIGMILEVAIDASEAALAIYGTLSALQTAPAVTGPSAVRADDSTGCSFCGKGLADGVRLAHGPGVRICNECVRNCGALVGE